MRYRKLGNSDLNVSVVGIGTWGMSGQGWESSHTSDDEQSIATIRAAVDAGINFIDTALTYGSGHAEELVGEAVQGIRDKVIIATKCVADRESPEKGLTKDWRPEALRYQVEKSLRRMNIDVIDLYQAHWPDPDPSHPLEDAFRELNKMREEGLVRHIGVSNFSTEQIRQAMDYCPIASLQPRYSLLNRDIEEDILPFCVEHNIGVLSYGSLGGGVLTGKYTQRPEFHTINNMVDPRNSFYPHGTKFSAVRHQSVADGPIGLVSPNPRGCFNIIPVEEDWSDYPFLAAFGYNKAEKEDLSRLLGKVSSGATVLLTLGHLTCTTDRAAIERYDLAFEDHPIFEAMGFDGIPDCDNSYINGYSLPVGTNLAVSDGEVLIRTDDGLPLVVEKQYKKGSILFFNTLYYPANPAIKDLYIR